MAMGLILKGLLSFVYFLHVLPNCYYRNREHGLSSVVYSLVFSILPPRRLSVSTLPSSSQIEHTYTSNKA